MKADTVDCAICMEQANTVPTLNHLPPLYQAKSQPQHGLLRPPQILLSNHLLHVQGKHQIEHANSEDSNPATAAGVLAGMVEEGLVGRGSKEWSK